MYRILLCHDTEVELPNGEILRWAYANRTHALKKYAPEGWIVDRSNQCDIPATDLREYDLIFMLDYMEMQKYRIHLNGRRNNCILVTSFNKDGRSRQEFWDKMPGIADWVIVNNWHRWFLGGYPRARTCNISNGVDTDQWQNTKPIASRDHIVGWCGSSDTKKGKRYDELLVSLRTELEQRGFQCSFRPINDITPDVVYTPDQQRDWYNECSYVICTSESEGTPSFLLEGAACGCVPITTNCGNAPEWCKHGENSVLIHPDIDEIVKAMEFARANRDKLSAMAEGTMEGWSYGHPGDRAKWFYTLFRRLIENGISGVLPFTWVDSDLDVI